MSDATKNLPALPTEAELEAIEARGPMHCTTNDFLDIIELGREYYALRRRILEWTRDARDPSDEIMPMSAHGERLMRLCADQVEALLGAGP